MLNRRILTVADSGLTLQHPCCTGNQVVKCGHLKSTRDVHFFSQRLSLLTETYNDRISTDDGARCDGALLLAAGGRPRATHASDDSLQSHGLGTGYQFYGRANHVGRFRSISRALPRPKPVAGDDRIDDLNSADNFTSVRRAGITAKSAASGTPAKTTDTVAENSATNFPRSTVESLPCRALADRNRQDPILAPLDRLQLHDGLAVRGSNFSSVVIGSRRCRNRNGQKNEEGPSYSDSPGVHQATQRRVQNRSSLRHTKIIGTVYSPRTATNLPSCGCAESHAARNTPAVCLRMGTGETGLRSTDSGQRHQRLAGVLPRPQSSAIRSNRVAGDPRRMADVSRSQITQEHGNDTAQIVPQASGFRPASRPAILSVAVYPPRDGLTGEAFPRSHAKVRRSAVAFPCVSRPDAPVHGGRIFRPRK